MSHSAVSPPPSPSNPQPASDIFLQACRGIVTPRPPLWMMRQAGRYLPEYQAVRAQYDFSTVCTTPELACEVTLQPLRRFAFDAAIIFADIMTPLQALGMEIGFNPGPVVKNPIRSAADVAGIVLPEGPIAPYVAEAIGLFKRASSTPLIGFCGAPLTLAAYLIQGRGERDFPLLRAFIAAQPAAAQQLLNILAQAMVRYLRAQVEAGAAAVQIFDTWAGVLSPELYRSLVLPSVRMLLEGLADLRVPRIYFAPHAAACWAQILSLPCEVFGVDWRSSMAAVRQQAPRGAVLQGNLDPAILLSSEQAVREGARRICAENASQPFIFNLGHGILPGTPIAHVEALVAAVRGG